MDWPAFFFSMVALTIPGVWICNRLGLTRASEWIPFSLLFSMIGLGWISYTTHLFAPFATDWPVMIGIVGILLILFDVKKKEWKVLLPILPRRDEWIGIVWLGILFLAVALINLRYPFIAYDTLSYHQAFREWFAQPALFPSFESPMNLLEARANGFPKLFEALGGAVQGVSPHALAILPILVGIGIASIMYRLSCEAEKPSMLAPLLGIGSVVVLIQLVSDYVDLFFSFVLLGIIYLLSTGPPSTRRTGIAFFLMGCLASIKIIAPLYWIGLIPILVWFSSRWKNQWTTHAAFFVFGVLPLAIDWGFQLPLLPWMGLEGAAPSNMHVAREGSLSFLAIGTQLVGLNAYTFILIGIIMLLSVHWKKILKTAPIEWKWLACASIPFIYFTFHALQSSPNGWNPSSFYRYTLPFFLVGGVVLGIAVQNATKDKKWRIIKHGLLMGAGIVFILPTLMVAIQYSQSHENESAPMIQTMNLFKQTITSSDTVFFANTPNLLSRGYDYFRLTDAYTYRNNPDLTCEKLQSDGVVRVVVFYPDIKRGLSNVDNRIQEESITGKCGNELGRIPNWVAIYGLD